MSACGLIHYHGELIEICTLDEGHDTYHMSPTGYRWGPVDYRAKPAEQTVETNKLFPRKGACYICGREGRWVAGMPKCAECAERYARR